MQNYKTFAKLLKLTKLSERKYSKKPVNTLRNQQFTERRKASMLYTLPSVILQLNFRALHSFMSPCRLTS